MTAAGYYDTSYPPSLWAPGPAPKMPVAVGAVVTNPVIAAMPPAEQLPAINAAYEGNPLTAWTAGQSATVAGNIVAWNGGAFVPFVAERTPAAKPAPKTKAKAEPAPETQPVPVPAEPEDGPAEMGTR